MSRTKVPAFLVPCVNRYATGTSGKTWIFILISFQILNSPRCLPFMWAFIHHMLLIVFYSINNIYMEIYIYIYIYKLTLGSRYFIYYMIKVLMRRGITLIFLYNMEVVMWKWKTWKIFSYRNNSSLFSCTHKNVNATDSLQPFGYNWPNRQ